MFNKIIIKNKTLGKKERSLRECQVKQKSLKPLVEVSHRRELMNLPEERILELRYNF